MKTNNHINNYPYLQVVIMFVSLSSIIGGLIAQLTVLWIFREANFAQIGYQPLLYVGLLGFIPALLTGVILAYKQIWHGSNKSMLTIFLTGFMISALYIGIIVIYLGITTIEEVSLLVIFMITIGLFGGINSAIASVFALPKACKTSFDKDSKKGDDIYKELQPSE